MKTDLKGLGPLLRQRLQAVEADIHAAGKRAAKAALREAVLGTPVKSGRARANWRVGRGAAPGGVLEAQDRDGPATIARG